MQILLGFGVRIPEEVRIVGMDDVKYASRFPWRSPPSTRIAPASAVAMATMLERLEHPEFPLRDVLVPTRLVVRKNCGAHLHSEVADAPQASVEPAN